MNRFELENFIIQNGSDIYSFCCWLTRDKPEADDLFQDTFVKALEKQERLPSTPEEIKKFLLYSLTIRIAVQNAACRPLMRHAALWTGNYYR